MASPAIAGHPSCAPATPSRQVFRAGQASLASHHIKQTRGSPTAQFGEFGAVLQLALGNPQCCGQFVMRSVAQVSQIISIIFRK